MPQLPFPSIVHMFWHGPPLSRLERLCMRSFLAHGHAVHLHVYEEPRDVPAGITILDAANILPQRHLFAHAKSGSFALFADWFRYRLLYEQGGFWADTDVVCLKPMSYTAAEIFGWQDERVINNAVLGLPRAHKLAEWMANSCEKPNRIHAYDPPRTRRRKLIRRLQGKSRAATAWGESGPEGLTQAARHFGYADQALPFWHFYPIHYLNWRTVFDSSLRGNHAIVSGSTALHLWNEMARRTPEFDRNGVFPADSLFEQLCNRYL